MDEDELRQAINIRKWIAAKGHLFKFEEATGEACPSVKECLEEARARAALRTPQIDMESPVCEVQMKFWERQMGE